MFRKIPFEQNELRIVATIPGRFGGPDTPVRDTPVSSRENMIAMYYDKQPYWTPIPVDSGMIMPQLYNNQLGRGGPGGTKDAFGVEWEYVEVVSGSIVRPGAPYLENVNEWKDKIRFPNLDEWDWAAEAEAFPIDKKRSGLVSLVNGFWFERLVSFMEFAPAAMALIDEEQEDAVRSFFEASTEFGMKVVDKLIAYWPALDGINIHDDWGSQKAPFFSQEVAYKFFVPCMKALTDHIHAKGRYATLHSCGHLVNRIQCFIDGGFDAWDPQTMNDTHALYDQYGDQILIGVVPDPFDPETTSEEEQRRRAREHFDRFCKPGKPSYLSFYGAPALTPAFSDELYTYSRKKYGGFL
ncbi:MAG: methyltransferase [Clostridiales bacterium]|nr:methyltransferase [Clostridiales bacterium]